MRKIGQKLKQQMDLILSSNFLFILIFQLFLSMDGNTV